MKLDTYLRLPLAKRLAMFRKAKANHVCGYPHPDGSGRWQLTPILQPDRNSHFEIGSSVCIWEESPELRKVGFADEVTRLRHKGWYVAEYPFQDEVARGVVFRLPHGRFMAAVADPFQSGPCLLEICSYDSAADAALAADSLAARYAEDAREYDAKQRAEQKAEEAAREAANQLEWEERDVETVDA